VSLYFDARIAARDFDVAFTLEKGETVAVLGPNGAGKSTLLALLAGVLTPDSGSASLDNSVLFDGTSSVPAHHRGVSLLAQEPLLFPHLSVLENVAFGPRSSGLSRSGARTVARRWLDEVDAAEFAGRRPAQLSGGQAQRVAVARALAAEPKLLLLDEPMAALDVTVVPTMRSMLKRVLADRAVIIVTHDVVDAYTLADRVIVLESGHIVDSGPTRDVLARPRTQFAAALVGLNLLADGESVVAPGAVSVATVPPAPSPSLVVIEGTIAGIETRGDLVRVRVGDVAADLTPLAFADLALLPGERVWLSYATPQAVEQ
jgi:molybdate transport system ATP-binding protein